MSDIEACNHPLNGQRFTKAEVVELARLAYVETQNGPYGKRFAAKRGVTIDKLDWTDGTSPNERIWIDVLSRTLRRLGARVGK